MYASNLQISFSIRIYIYINNFYNSCELAISYLKQKNHIVETVRNNKKFISKKIFQNRLKKERLYSNVVFK